MNRVESKVDTVKKVVAELGEPFTTRQLHDLVKKRRDDIPFKLLQNYVSQYLRETGVIKRMDKDKEPDGIARYEPVATKDPAAETKPEPDPEPDPVPEAKPLDDTGFAVPEPIREEWAAREESPREKKNTDYRGRPNDG